MHTYELIALGRGNRLGYHDMRTSDESTGNPLRKVFRKRQKVSHNRYPRIRMLLDAVTALTGTRMVGGESVGECVFNCRLGEML